MRLFNFIRISYRIQHRKHLLLYLIPGWMCKMNYTVIFVLWLATLLQIFFLQNIHTILANYWSTLFLSKGMLAIRNTWDYKSSECCCSLSWNVIFLLSLWLVVDQTSEATGAVCQRRPNLAEDCPFLHRASGQSWAPSCQSGTEELPSGSQTDW